APAGILAGLGALLDAAHGEAPGAKASPPKPVPTAPEKAPKQEMIHEKVEGTVTIPKEKPSAPPVEKAPAGILAGLGALLDAAHGEEPGAKASPSKPAPTPAAPEEVPKRDMIREKAESMVAMPKRKPSVPPVEEESVGVLDGPVALLDALHSTYGATPTGIFAGVAALLDAAHGEAPGTKASPPKPVPTKAVPDEAPKQEMIREKAESMSAIPKEKPPAPPVEEAPVSSLDGPVALLDALHSSYGKAHTGIFAGLAALLDSAHGVASDAKESPPKPVLTKAAPEEEPEQEIIREKLESSGATAKKKPSAPSVEEESVGIFTGLAALLDAAHGEAPGAKGSPPRPASADPEKAPKQEKSSEKAESMSATENEKPSSPPVKEEPAGIFAGVAALLDAAHGEAPTAKRSPLKPASDAPE
ncbi:MAG: hypothetical protein GY731_19050, partial [Gammaproteobacteria bacterium]|nr:hypothetical protein [Gammaproteobacteria bacterium]